MNIWPFKNTDETPRLEKRADAYQDALVRQLLEEADTAVDVSTGATAALEACAGLVSRAFMAAEVEASDTIRNALTPELLGMIGRALIRRGESVFDIDTTRGNIDLAPVNEYDITGGARPWDWVYSLTIAGPSDIETRNDVSEASVIHCRYAVEPSKPWRGLGPLDVANIAGKLSAETASALADEAQGPRGHFLPLPVDGSDSTITNMKADIRTARGNVLTVESGDWDNAGGNRNSEYETKRFGADPPQGVGPAACRVVPRGLRGVWDFAVAFHGRARHGPTRELPAILIRRRRAAWSRRVGGTDGQTRRCRQTRLVRLARRRHIRARPCVPING